MTLSGLKSAQTQSSGGLLVWAQDLRQEGASLTTGKVIYSGPDKDSDSGNMEDKAGEVWNRRGARDWSGNGSV